MAEEQREDKKTLEVMMPMDQASGRYANMLRVGHTATEFILHILGNSNR